MFTDTKTPAKDEAEIASTVSAKTKQRTNRVICIILLCTWREKTARLKDDLPNVEGTILWLRWVYKRQLPQFVADEMCADSTVGCARYYPQVTGKGLRQ
jgi:hypothetical protein